MPVWAWVLVGLTASWVLVQIVVLVWAFCLFLRELTRR